jgi:HK97 family phage major capsid protein
MAATQSELRLANRIDERELVRSKHEAKLAEVEAREDKNLTESDRTQLTMLREQAAELDTEISDLAGEIDAHNKAMEESKKLRRALSGSIEGVDVDGDGVVYRSMATYARDVILTGQGRVAGQIAAQVGDKSEIQRAQERLQMVKRLPANTLSENVEGLSPPQHIAQIFQVIDASRPLVEAAGNRVGLDRGTVTYPVVTTSPVVAAQATEKTEAGNTGMVIDMVTKTATTYLGGGDLSWQAINWSSPDALEMWFRLTAADYALKTETDAATIVSASAFLNNIASPIATTATFAQTMTAVGAGYAEVYANSGRTANAIIMAPDRFGYLLGLTSDALTQFVSVGQAGIGPLRVIVSRGLNAGEMIVGDMDGLLVAETPGAPVELRVVEPAIGGVEVGLIGAFEAAVVDDGAFALITTAS